MPSARSPRGRRPCDSVQPRPRLGLRDPGQHLRPGRPRRQRPSPTSSTRTATAVPTAATGPPTRPAAPASPSGAPAPRLALRLRGRHPAVPEASTTTPTTNNGGTRISANKPVAMSYGQDTERARRSGPDPRHGLRHLPGPPGVPRPGLHARQGRRHDDRPAPGGDVTYTLTLAPTPSDPWPVTQVSDLLPRGPRCTPGGREPLRSGTTLVTYPDLFQSTADPVVDTRSRASGGCASPGTLTSDARISTERQRDPDRSATAIRLPAAPGATPAGR